MADYEVSKVMWMAIVVALAASIFIIAKPEIKSLAEGTFDNIKHLVDGTNTATDPPVENPSTNSNDYDTTANFAENGTFAMKEDGTAVLWATDPDKPVVVKDWATTYGEGEGTPSGKTANNEKLTSLTIASSVKVEGNAMALFSSNPNLKTINGLDKVDVSSVTSMTMMFAANNKLKALDVSTWDTSNVTDFSVAFGVGLQSDSSAPHSELTSLKLGNMNTSKGTKFGSMFNGLTNLQNFTAWQKLDYSHAQGDLMGMGGFLSSTTITDVDLTNVKLPKELHAQSMFAIMPNVKSIKFGQPIKFTSLSGAFISNPNLEVLDLSGTDVSAVSKSDANTMLSDNKLKTFNVPYTDAISEGLAMNRHFDKALLDAYNAQK